jgi:hypothetical protein
VPRARACTAAGQAVDGGGGHLGAGILERAEQRLHGLVGFDSGQVDGRARARLPVGGVGQLVEQRGQRGERRLVLGSHLEHPRHGVAHGHLVLHRATHVDELGEHGEARRDAPQRLRTQPLGAHAPGGFQDALEGRRQPDLRQCE